MKILIMFLLSLNIFASDNICKDTEDCVKCCMRQGEIHKIKQSEDYKLLKTYCTVEEAEDISDELVELLMKKYTLYDYYFSYLLCKDYTPYESTSVCVKKECSQTKSP